MARLIYAALCVAVAFTSASANAQDVKVSHYDVLKKCDKVTFLEKTAKEATTPEGKALISVAASLVGIDPSIVSVGLAAIPIELRAGHLSIYSFAGWLYDLLGPAFEFEYGCWRQGN